MSDLADEPPSLLDWATRLAVDPRLRARLADDPRGLLDEQGFARVPPADLHHALSLVTDSVAARLGVDIDGDLVDGVDVQRVGEHPLDALARQFVHLSEVVLAAPVEEPHDLDDLDGPGATDGHIATHAEQAPDPTALLDDLPGLHHPGPPPDVGSDPATHVHDALTATGYGSGPAVATVPAPVEEVLLHPPADLHPDVAVVGTSVVDPVPDPPPLEHPDHSEHPDHPDHPDPTDHAVPGHDVLDL